MLKSAFTSILLSVVLVSMGQEKERVKEKKSVKEVINKLPDMLIAQPDAGVDTNANKLINDNMYIVINPLWRDKGLQTIIEFKVLKTDKEPLKGTFPLPDKELVNGLVIGMGTAKKTATEKKQTVLIQIKNHLAAYYKESETAITAQELAAKTDAMTVSSETFTTNQGKTGELYFMNDIQTTQSNFIALLLIPGPNAASTHFVQFSYIHYTYETTLPEDALELKMFVYPDEQQVFIDFTKNILQTLKIN
jgi:hypothetical protein